MEKVSAMRVVATGITHGLPTVLIREGDWLMFFAAIQGELINTFSCRSNEISIIFEDNPPADVYNPARKMAAAEIAKILVGKVAKESAEKLLNQKRGEN